MPGLMSLGSSFSAQQLGQFTVRLPKSCFGLPPPPATSTSRSTFSSMFLFSSMLSNVRRMDDLKPSIRERRLDLRHERRLKLQKLRLNLLLAPNKKDLKILHLDNGIDTTPDNLARCLVSAHRIKRNTRHLSLPKGARIITWQSR